MQEFIISLNQMLVLFLFMALGFFLNKRKLLPQNAAGVLAKLETNLLVPCLIFNTFNKYCSLENFRAKWVYILYGAAIMAASLAIAIPLTRLFTKDAYKKKVYQYSFAVANFSFMGNAVVAGIYGSAVLFDYMMLTLPFNLYVYSYGVASLAPVENGKRFSLKSLVNPICIAMLIGIVCGLTGVFNHLHTLTKHIGLTQLVGNESFSIVGFLNTAIESAGACMSPLAMLLTGFVIGGYDIKELASDKKIYFVSLLRLILIPAAFIAMLILTGADKAILLVALCATAMPLGLNTVVIPASFGSDTTDGAAMALISHLMSIATIPLMFMLFELACRLGHIL